MGELRSRWTRGRWNTGISFWKVILNFYKSGPPFHFIFSRFNELHFCIWIYYINRRLIMNDKFEKSYHGLLYGTYEHFLEAASTILTSHTFHAFHSYKFTCTVLSLPVLLWENSFNSQVFVALMFHVRFSGSWYPTVRIVGTILQGKEWRPRAYPKQLYQYTSTEKLTILQHVWFQSSAAK
jgi:hypothetical protein